MREDEYTIVEDVVAPGEPGDNHHLVDYQTQELVSRLWSKYLVVAREGLGPSAAQPALRRVSYTLDNESFAGQKLQRGMKAVSRTRRTCTFSGGLWHIDDGRMVHASELVTVWVDPKKGAVEVPEDFWAAVEKLEGHAIPVTERAG
jgi:hypothetical protein